MEKQKITVRVAGRSYTLVSSDPPEHVRRVAELLNRQLREMELVSNLPAHQVMTLTSLNLEDQLVKAQDEIRELKRRLMERSGAETQADGEDRGGTAE